MKKIIATALFGGAVAGSLLGAWPAGADDPTPAGCVERTTRYSPESDLTYTCENGQWHEGPYGYHPGG